MNKQLSKGNNSPIINGNGNIVTTGGNNKVNNSSKKSTTIKKVAEYTIGGIIIALLISILASYIYNSCTDSRDYTNDSSIVVPGDDINETYTSPAD